MAWDYEAIDKAMTEKLYQESVWFCPLCGATREPVDWRNFTSQYPPSKPCKYCGARLTHGIKSNDGSGRVGPWYSRACDMVENSNPQARSPPGAGLRRRGLRALVRRVRPGVRGPHESQGTAVRGNPAPGRELCPGRAVWGEVLRVLPVNGSAHAVKMR